MQDQNQEKDINNHNAIIKSLYEKLREKFGVNKENELSAWSSV